MLRRASMTEENRKIDETEESIARIAERMETEIRAITTAPPGTTRPPVRMTDARAEQMLRAKVALRVESIVQMAFMVWLRECRGEAPMIGPLDVWKLNEIKRIIFSITETNNDFQA
jgi:hypothetical protein